MEREAGGTIGLRPLERRLAAILVADAAGFSRSVARDEEGALRALKGHLAALEPLVGLNGGRVFNRAGDGFLAEFGSVVAAVSAAVSMQRLVAERNARDDHDDPLKFRIGVHVGDVTVDGQDLLGDTVNLASRLEGIAPVGGIAVSERVTEDVAGKLDVRFRFLGPRALKNMPRPVPVHVVELDPGTSRAAAAPARPTKPSVAVLAFDNLSGDAEQDYFADGIAEDIITGLSRVPWIFVIARNSSFSYKGLSVDIRRVGRDLGVQYVLEGSVRRAGARLRVTGQLIDADTGRHIWADRHDGLVDDVFELQDRITSAVIGAIAPQIRSAEIERAAQKRPENLTAYDHFLQAQAGIYNFRFTAADAHLAEAVEREPGYAQAKALRAWIRTLLWNPDTRPSDERYDFAIRLANEVLAAPDADIEAQAYAGYVIAFLTGETDRGLALVQRATDLCPNCVSAWGSSCILHGLMGDTATALAHADAALRLNPADPLSYRVHMGTSLAHIANRDFEALLLVSRQARAFHNSVPVFRLNEIAAEMALGNAGRARDLARLYIAREPDFTVSLYRRMRARIHIAASGVYEPFYRLLAEAGMPA